MPLDSGEVTRLFRTEGARDMAAMPSLDYGPDIGAAFKAAREARGLSLQDVSERTRVRRQYLAALEDMQLDQLPSRPFAIGYVKSYAGLLGFDEDKAVARFKLSSPDAKGELRAPIGVSNEPERRFGVIGAVGAVVVAAIVMWNVAQRAIIEDAPPPPSAPDANFLAPVLNQPVALGEPLPAPMESTTPTLYVTPGLEAAAAAGGSASAAIVAAKERALAEAAQKVEVEPGPPVFTPAGTVYGAAQGTSPLILQARKSAALVAKSPNGQIYFSRYLSKGEAYRAPIIPGLQVDVSDPKAFDVYIAGQARGVLDAPLTPISKLLG